jgi:hypothetical protein
MKKLKKYLLPFVVLGLGVIVATQTNTKKLKPFEMAEREDGTKFRAPVFEPRNLPQPVPLKVIRFEVQQLAEGTAFGKPGDVLLTFIGQGFIDSSLCPRVILSKEFILKDTYLNKKGTELYVIIPAKIIESEIKKMKFKEAIIENPGGTVKMEFKRTRVKILPKDLLEIDPKAKKVRLIVRKYFVEREVVEEKKKE